MHAKASNCKPKTINASKYARTGCRNEGPAKCRPCLTVQFLFHSRAERASDFPYNEVS